MSQKHNMSVESQTKKSKRVKPSSSVLPPRPPQNLASPASPDECMDYVNFTPCFTSTPIPSDHHMEVETKNSLTEIPLPPSSPCYQASQAEAPLNPDQWLGFDQDTETEKGLLNAMIEAEDLEKVRFALEKARFERKIINESYRLVDEVVYPLTKTGGKLVAVGVKPLDDFEPTLRIYNPELTAAMLFNLNEFEQFVQVMKTMVQCIEEVPTEIVLCKIENYTVSLLERKVLKFTSKRKGEVYKPVFMILDTINTLLNLADHLMNLMQSRCVKNKYYPDFDRFIVSIALHINQNGYVNFDEVVYEVIRKIENNHNLYEIFLKLPLTIKKRVDEKLQYFLDNNQLTYM